MTTQWKLAIDKAVVYREVGHCPVSSFSLINSSSSLANPVMFRFQTLGCSHEFAGWSCQCCQLRQYATRSKNRCTGFVCCTYGCLSSVCVLQFALMMHEMIYIRFYGLELHRFHISCLIGFTPMLITSTTYDMKYVV